MGIDQRVEAAADAAAVVSKGGSRLATWPDCMAFGEAALAAGWLNVPSVFAAAMIYHDAVLTGLPLVFVEAVGPFEALMDEFMPDPDVAPAAAADVVADPAPAAAADVVADPAPAAAAAVVADPAPAAAAADVVADPAPAAAAADVVADPAPAAAAAGVVTDPPPAAAAADVVADPAPAAAAADVVADPAPAAAAADVVADPAPAAAASDHPLDQLAATADPVASPQQLEALLAAARSIFPAEDAVLKRRFCEMLKVSEWNQLPAAAVEKQLLRLQEHQKQTTAGGL